MLVMPADHIIRDVASFQSAARAAEPFARTGCLVTFGIVPTSVETAYGYISKGKGYESSGGSNIIDSAAEVAPFQVLAFVEKPDSVTAERMLQSGDYLWNSGCS